MTSGPNVSILTPTYGYNRFLGSCLASTHSAGVSLEHIVVDGGSTDGTVDTLETLSRARPSLKWVSEPDEGQSDALNKALALATGDVIGWLNADEFYLPGAVASAVEVLQANPEVDVVFGDAAVTDEAGRYQSLLGEHRFSASVLLGRCFIPTCTLFIRRSALEGWSFDTVLRVVMDWDLYCWLSRRGARFRYLGQAIAGFRLHPEQVTAVGRAASASETPILAERYGVNDQPLTLTRIRADLAHAYLKLQSGAYVREWRLRRLRDHPIDWTTGEARALRRARYIADLR